MKQVALITGASSGIGRDAALRLLERGFTVYAAARRVERMSDIAARGGHTLSLDVTDNDSVRQCIEEVVSAEGQLDVLVNNAGYGEFGAVENISDSQARRQFDVNVFGMAAVIRAVLPQMRKQHSGRIIITSSMGGLFSEPCGGWYHATKYAVEALGDSLRMEVSAFGIKVSLVEPGAIASEWSGIALDNLRTTSLGTPYEKSAARQAAFLEKVYSGASSPEVIGRAIEHAATAHCPRTRYLRGHLSHLLVWSARLLPTRCFDRVVKFLMQ